VHAAALAVWLVLLVVIAPAAHGQAMAKRMQVGTLGPTPMPPGLYEVLKQNLAQMGLTEGQQITIVHQHGGGESTRLASVAGELLRSRPDVIFARGPDAVAAVARATTTVPIVALDLESDPIALRYAKTLARPGGNVTGVFLDLPELSGKQLQLIREVVPGISRIALVGDPVGNAAQFRETDRAAQSLGLQVQNFKGRTVAELETALEAARRGGAGGVLVFSSPIVFSGGPRIAALARERRLPSVGLFSEFAEAGGLLTYGPSMRESYRRCAVYLARILNGAKPDVLPIERPEKFELVVNMKTARALGLTIPEALLRRADQIIE